MSSFHRARNAARLRPAYNHKSWNIKKKKVRLKSWRKWVAGLIDQAAVAVRNHDYAKESQIYRALGRKSRGRQLQPTTHPQTGQLLTSGAGTTWTGGRGY